MSENFNGPPDPSQEEIKNNLEELRKLREEAFALRTEVRTKKTFQGRKLVEDNQVNAQEIYARNILNKIEKQNKNLTKATPDQKRIAIGIYEQLVEVIYDWERDGYFELPDLASSQDHVNRLLSFLRSK